MTGSPSQAPPPEQEGSPPARESSESALRYKTQAVWVTNLTTIVGLAMGAGEAFLHANPRRDIVILCGVFVMGAQVAGDIALRVIDRLFARGS